jgi:hypothetical protein
MLSLTLGHNLNSLDAHKVHECIACIQGKLSKKPSRWQLLSELPPPLYRIHDDVCGPINPPSGAFRCFFVLIDASSSHLEVSLLPTRNMLFPKLLAILIRYWNHFPDFPIKYLRMNNAQEFCGLAEAFTNKIQLVIHPLLLRAQCPSSMWRHVVLHATILLKLRPTLLNVQTPAELQSGRTPDVSHIRIFGYQVWDLVPKPKRYTVGPHKEERIYVGFDSPFIIQYLVHTT